MNRDRLLCSLVLLFSCISCFLLRCTRKVLCKYAEGPKTVREGSEGRTRKVSFLYAKGRAKTALFWASVPPASCPEGAKSVRGGSSPQCGVRADNFSVRGRSICGSSRISEDGAASAFVRGRSGWWSPKGAFVRGRSGGGRGFGTIRREGRGAGPFFSTGRRARGVERPC